MNFQIYSENFRSQAEKAGYDESYIHRCLTYASKIHENRLPIVFTLKHLSLLVGVDESYIRSVAFLQERYYRTFKIPKRSGGEREISEPLPNLKEIQRWILDNVLYRISPSPYAKAFVQDKSIKENARFHRSQRMVLTIDIKNFFPSLSTKLVKNFFKDCGYSRRVTYYLTRMCTLNGGLPQGAPTSPALSNIFLKEFDMIVAEHCKPLAIRYTRYADDLTFSGNFEVNPLITFIKKELRKLDLKVNDSKTRLMYGHQRQEVTGIVVNKKLQVPRKMRRDLRQIIYYIDKYGLDNHLSNIKETRANYIAHISGICDFILFVNPCDRDALKGRSLLK